MDREGGMMNVWEKMIAVIFNKSTFHGGFVSNVPYWLGLGLDSCEWCEIRRGGGLVKEASISPCDLVGEGRIHTEWGAHRQLDGSQVDYVDRNGRRFDIVRRDGKIERKYFTFTIQCVIYSSFRMMLLHLHFQHSVDAIIPKKLIITTKEIAQGPWRTWSLAQYLIHIPITHTIYY